MSDSLSLFIRYLIDVSLSVDDAGSKLVEIVVVVVVVVVVLVVVIDVEVSVEEALVQGCIFFPKIEFFINHYLVALSFVWSEMPISG